MEDCEQADEEVYDSKLKLMIIGETKVGKTALITRYTKNTFTGTYLTTIGIDFQVKYVPFEDKRVRLQIWDTAGQERFRNIAKSYFHSSNGFIVVYDISNKDSFEKLNFWIEQIKLNAPENTICILVGNKSDLETERQIKKEQGEKLSEQIGMKFFEVSAKDGTNVEEAFQVLVNEIMNFAKKNGTINKRSSQVLSTKKTLKEKKNCC